MRKVIIIPARLESTRFHGKLLLPYKEGFVIDAAIAIAKEFENEVEIVVATDNDRIAEVANNNYVHVIKTQSNHLNWNLKNCPSCKLYGFRR